MSRTPLNPVAVQYAVPTRSSIPDQSVALAAPRLGPEPCGISAIAIFDRSGILEGCKLRSDAPQNWTDAAFHTIGLKKLLTTCLKQQNFEYAKMSAPGCTTFILRRRSRYVAIVAASQSSVEEASFAQRLRQLSLAELIGLASSPQLATVA